MLRRLFCLLLSFLLLSLALASCGSVDPNPEDGSQSPASSQESGQSEPEGSTDPAPATEPATEPAAEPGELIPPEKPAYEKEYAAPEDGSFTICGVPLTEYTQVLYWNGNSDYAKLDFRKVRDGLTDLTTSATGLELTLKVVRNERMFEKKEYEHEILFGTGFVRDGIPETNLKKNYYGVTEDGTVYFSSPSYMLYPYLWQLFLEEFCGVPVGSGERSAGCEIGPCYRELQTLDTAVLEAQGYSKVFDDEFDGEELNLDVWETVSNGPRREGYNAPSQVSVEDGKLILRGQYLTDGEFGEGWYGVMLGLKQRYCRGYFEASIKCSENMGRGYGDFWSAFWIEGPSPYVGEDSQGGIGPGGAELDILELFGDGVTNCIWVSGVEGVEGLSAEVCEIHKIGDNYSEEFHTYAMLWDENYYRIYLDGMLITCTNHAYGTSRVEEQVLITMETSNGYAISTDTVREMQVEYLRIWQR